MFFHIEFDKTFSLEPKYLGPNLSSILKRKIHNEIEGTCSGRYGFIIYVTKITRTNKPMVQHGTGYILFDVKLSALVFRPFKGEVLDGVVFELSKMGFFVNVGPLQVFISKNFIPKDFEYEAVDNLFLSQTDGVKIEKNTEIRLRIIGIRFDSTDIFAIGTINEDYLGILI